MLIAVWRHSQKTKIHVQIIDSCIEFVASKLFEAVKIHVQNHEIHMLFKPGFQLDKALTWP